MNLPVGVILCAQEDDDMRGRRRRQAKGWLRIQNGVWRLTFRAYGKPGEDPRQDVMIGPAVGRGKLTQKQAERFAWEHYLSKVDLIAQQQPSLIALSLLTVQQFWRDQFVQSAALRLKKTTREQYYSLYGRWIGPVIAGRRLQSIEPSDVEACIAYAIQGGMSSATARHVRKVISAIFTRAKKLRFFQGDNPTSIADVPRLEPVREKQALSAPMMAQVLSLLEEPVRTMALTAVITSANVSELCGLRWKHINLTEEWKTLDGDGLPPATIAIRQHWTRGETGTLKTGNRRRNIPIPLALVSALARLKYAGVGVDGDTHAQPLGRLSAKLARSSADGKAESGVAYRFPEVSQASRSRVRTGTPASNPRNGPDDVVFSYPNGRPINENSTRRWAFRAVAKALHLPRLGWHTFRYSHATFTQAIGMNARDRQALMGHGALDMTDRYTQADHERMRGGLDQIMRMILDSGGSVQ